jgi:NAD(P)-dependent dehydrogenase (short-subunit alcohol dehydrogenase family)
MPLTQQTVVVVGGSSGIGLAVAQGARQLGARVIILASRAHNLDTVARQLGELETAVVDIRKEHEVAKFFAQLDTLDHVVITAGASIASAAIAQVDVAEASNAIQVKLLGSLLVAKHAAPKLRAGGSIGFTSGVLGRKPAVNSVIKTVINAALEAAVRQLAKELAPRRVYAISPGPVNTPSWQFADEASRTKMFDKLAASLPVGFVATANDTAAGYLFAMQAHALTGAVIDLDSGALVS